MPTAPLIGIELRTVALVPGAKPQPAPYGYVLVVQCPASETAADVLAHRTRAVRCSKREASMTFMLVGKIHLAWIATEEFAWD